MKAKKMDSNVEKNKAQHEKGRTTSGFAKILVLLKNNCSLSCKNCSPAPHGQLYY